MEIGSWTERTQGKADSGRLGWARWQLVDLVRQWIADWVVPHSCSDKLGGITEEQDRAHNPEFQCRDIKPQTSD